MVGLIDDEKHITTQWFKNDDDIIILVGTVNGASGHRNEIESLGGSRFLKVCHGLKIGPVPRLDLPHEIKMQNAVRDLIRASLVESAHDCSEGGLAIALAESCFNPARLFGADVDCSCRPMGDAPTVLFNESQSRIIVSVAPEKLDNALALLQERDVPFQQLGKVGGGALQIRIDEQSFRWSISEIYDEWWNAIHRAVGQEESIPSL